MSLRSTLLLATAVLALIACGPASEDPNPTTSDPQRTDQSPATTTPGGTPMPTSSPDLPTSDPSQQRLDAVRADLTARGVVGEVVVINSTARTWNDGSLGCPQPGQQYTQAVVQGWQMVVSVGDQTYDYRFPASGSPLLCESPIPQVTEPTGAPASAR